jgi:hypothetical protein
MSVHSSGTLTLPPTEPTKHGTPPADRWGTAVLFARLARVELQVAAYWLKTVYRPAHRAYHPRLNIAGCPGCAYETAQVPL